MDLKKHTTPVGKTRELEKVFGAVAKLNPIADPATATTTDVANAHNALLAALKGE
jgi:hypothetical protein